MRNAYMTLPLAFACLSIGAIFKRRLAIPLACITGCLILILLVFAIMVGGIGCRAPGFVDVVLLIGLMLAIPATLVWTSRSSVPVGGERDEDDSHNSKEANKTLAIV